MCRYAEDSTMDHNILSSAVANTCCHSYRFPLIQTGLPSGTSNTDMVQLPFLYALLPPELVYDDVFAVWETIWAAKCVSSSHFVLFIALALVEIYRDIILENNMDFTDIIKFFNGKTQLRSWRPHIPPRLPIAGTSKSVTQCCLRL